MKEVYDLRPVYDSRKSFYSKARVEVKDNKKLLYSYNVLVAEIDLGQAEVFLWYSLTTGRHIKEFLLQNGFEAEDKHQILKDYKVEI